MRNSHWIIALFLTISLGIGSSMAADIEKQATTNEVNNGAPVDTTIDHKDCPMHKGEKCPMHNNKEKCEHKNGEPCPYHDKGHYDKMHHSHENCPQDQAK